MDERFPSAKIVGWAADDTMPTALVTRAFERAVQAQRPSTGLLHHSDRGSQYASDAYRALLRRHGLARSARVLARRRSPRATLQTPRTDR